MKKILITGAGGFLGQNLIRQILNDDKYFIVALSSKDKELNTEFIEKKESFLCVPTDSVFSSDFNWNNIDYVVHCAFSRSEKPAELASSLKFGYELIDTVINHGVSNIINISSQSVYGSAVINKIEDAAVSPDSLYAIAKYSSEYITASLAKSRNVHYTNLRMASLVGPGMIQRIIPKLLNNVYSGKKITIVGGNQEFSYLDVRDAASGILALLNTNSADWKDLYNLGTHEKYSLMELVNTLLLVIDEYNIERVPVEKIDKDIVKPEGMNCSKFYSDTHWLPKYNLKDMIRYQIESDFMERNRCD